MHTEMWEHPATQANVATLRSRGAHVIDPAVGRLTGQDTGAGRLPEPEQLYAACLAILEGARRTAAPRPGARPRGPSGRRVGRWHPRAARPRALPRQPLLGQAGLGHRPLGSRPRGRGHPRRRQRVAPGPRRGAGRARRDDPRAAGGGAGRRGRGRRRRHGRGAGRLPAGDRQRQQDQEVERPRRRPARRARREPRHRARVSCRSAPRGAAVPSSSASPPRRATRRARSWTTPARSSPARAATSRSSTRSGATSPSARTRRRCTCCAAAPTRCSPSARVQGRRRRRALGHRLIDARLTTTLTAQTGPIGHPPS